MSTASPIQTNVVASTTWVGSKNPRATRRGPLVSVGIPTCNGADRISKAVMSILSQGYSNLEILISDNCSADTTQAVCVDLCQAYPCIRYFRQPENIGVMPNFRFVVDNAEGDLFMWMSDDDYLEPGIIEKYVQFLVNNPGYSLVSGQIQHWVGERPTFRERDFNFAQKIKEIRLLHFYFKVVYGSIFYGLMHRDVARQIPLKNRIGEDWHFIASVAYLGKIKNLDCVGYHKQCGGVSKNFKQYGKVMGAKSFAVNFPHVKIALDALSNIVYDSPVYARQPYVRRMMLGVFSLCSVLLGYYGKLYPLILGGKIKRLIGFNTWRKGFIGHDKKSHKKYPVASSAELPPEIRIE